MDWNRYMGSHVTPEEYAAEGGNLETIKRDLLELWGDPRQGNDYMTPKQIKRVAKKLAAHLL